MAKTADGDLVETEWTRFCDEIERGERNSPVESRLLALVLLPNTESKSTLRLWEFWGCWGVGEVVNPSERENSQSPRWPKTAATLHMLFRGTVWWRETATILSNVYVCMCINFKLNSIPSSVNTAFQIITKGLSIWRHSDPQCCLTWFETQSMTCWVTSFF